MEARQRKKVGPKGLEPPGLALWPMANRDFPTLLRRRPHPGASEMQCCICWRAPHWLRVAEICGASNGGIGRPRAFSRAFLRASFSSGAHFFYARDVQPPRAPPKNPKRRHVAACGCGGPWSGGCPWACIIIIIIADSGRGGTEPPSRATPGVVRACVRISSCPCPGRI